MHALPIICHIATTKHRRKWPHVPGADYVVHNTANVSVRREEMCELFQENSKGYSTSVYTMFSTASDLLRLGCRALHGCTLVIWRDRRERLVVFDYTVKERMGFYLCRSGPSQPVGSG